MNPVVLHYPTYLWLCVCTSLRAFVSIIKLYETIYGGSLNGVACRSFWIMWNGIGGLSGWTEIKPFLATGLIVCPQAYQPHSWLSVITLIINYYRLYRFCCRANSQLPQKQYCMDAVSLNSAFITHSSNGRKNSNYCLSASGRKGGKMLWKQ